jgi:hypothetical protein
MRHDGRPSLGEVVERPAAPRRTIRIVPPTASGRRWRGCPSAKQHKESIEWHSR